MINCIKSFGLQQSRFLINISNIHLKGVQPTHHIFKAYNDVKFCSVIKRIKAKNISENYRIPVLIGDLRMDPFNVIPS